MNLLEHWYGIYQVSEMGQIYLLSWDIILYHIRATMVITVGQHTILDKTGTKINSHHHFHPHQSTMKLSGSNISMPAIINYKLPPPLLCLIHQTLNLAPNNWATTVMWVYRYHLLFQNSKFSSKTTDYFF